MDQEGNWEIIFYDIKDRINRSLIALNGDKISLKHWYIEIILNINKIFKNK